MTETYTNFKTSVCENAHKCFYAGAAVPVLGLDVLLFRVSNGILTPAIHMALAGVLTELWCKWQPVVSRWVWMCCSSGSATAF